MKAEYLVRQMDMIPQSALDTGITIVGAGAVGGTGSLFLAKMGFSNQIVHDFDVIDDENMNCQMYKLSQIGMLKVHALSDLIQDFAGIGIEVHDTKVEATHEFLTEIVCIPVDSMAVRADLFKAFMSSMSCRYLVDTRMAIEYGEVIVVDKESRESVEMYRSTLHPDNEAVQQRCTNKSVMYTASIVAGVMCKAVKDIATNKKLFTKMVYNIEHNDCMFFS